MKQTARYILMVLTIVVIFLVAVRVIEEMEYKKTEPQKEVIEVSRLEGDFNKSYNNVRELWQESDIVIKGKVTETGIGEFQGTVRTMAQIDIEEIYKGDKNIDEIRIAVMGGIMEGEDFINSSFAKMFMEKGASLEQLRETYGNKLVKFSGFSGETIPEKDCEYIIFAVKSGLADGIWYITGGGYQQGLLETEGIDFVEEFSPEKKMKDTEPEIIPVRQLLEDVGK